jgi:hypothetical protein
MRTTLRVGRNKKEIKVYIGEDSSRKKRKQLGTDPELGSDLEPVPDLGRDLGP